MSRKLDGVRCIAICNGEIKLLSRQGKEFETLGVLKEELKKLNTKGYVLDGEVCLMDENGNEFFQEAMKEIRRKNHTIKNPRYLIFDILTIEEFQSGKSEITLEERNKRFIDLIEERTSIYIQPIPQTIIRSEEELNQHMDFAKKQGWEGLILRRADVGYKGKRSHDMLKVKKMQDAEYKVLKVIPGVIDDGHGHKVEGMSAVEIEHKGFSLQVGSGWNFEQRREYFKHPERLIGQTITVQFFEETKNKKGELSLRFPIVKAIHGKEREI